MKLEKSRFRKKRTHFYIITGISSGFVPVLKMEDFDLNLHQISSNSILVFLMHGNDISIENNLKTIK